MQPIRSQKALNVCQLPLQVFDLIGFFKADRLNTCPELKGIKTGTPRRYPNSSRLNTCPELKGIKTH